MDYDYRLRNHFSQCYSNAMDRWSAEEMVVRFKRIARPGIFRDETIEMEEIDRIEQFLRQLSPLATDSSTVSEFGHAMQRIIEIMLPMFADWGEGWSWHETIILAMSIHAEACRRDALAQEQLCPWLEGLIHDPSWPLDRAWAEKAYGNLFTA